MFALLAFTSLTSTFTEVLQENDPQKLKYLKQENKTIFFLMLPKDSISPKTNSVFHFAQCKCALVISTVEKSGNFIWVKKKKSGNFICS